ncbi:GNAT family N-acetyltransferase [Shewanella sp. HL-SH8]|uniref:GNAT family N-acetyltransferase n=1 Tax=Shewanella sp. HL-SH8 TaxID=3436242 RepID=UPI003EC1309D
MPSAYAFSHVSSIEEIGQDRWTQCFGESNPFMRYAFLHQLERSACIGDGTGWQTNHLVISDKLTAEIAAIVPLYLKTHSWGEYVFDWAWAEAYGRNQLEYYPKLVTSVPFIPASGQRIGFNLAITEDVKQSLLLSLCEYLRDIMAQQDYSSWHGLFISEQEHALWPKNAAITRVGTQFHWRNKNYTDFSDFLASMTSRKRKNISKERQLVANYQLSFRFVVGAEASLEQWQHFIKCYQMTYQKRSGHQGYLTAAFFLGLQQTMGEVIRLLIVTDVNGQMIASALFFVSDTHLYGRYWGTLTELDGLHFESCYYQGIDYAIAHNLSIFDAGAQGEHKVSRGFEPRLTYSKHIIIHPAFNDAISHYCQQEREQMNLYMVQVAQQLPFKN